MNLCVTKFALYHCKIRPQAVFVQTLITLDDTLQNRLRIHRTRRHALLAQLAELKRRQACPVSPMENLQIELLCKRLCNRLMDRNSQFGKKYLKLFLKEAVLTGQELHIKGLYGGILRALKNEELGSKNMVPSSVPVWLPSADSNHGHGG